MKEYSGRFYGIVPYYFTKFFAEIPFAIIFPALLVTIMYWGTNLNNEFVRFLECMGACALIGLAGQSTGIMIGCLFSDFRVASFMAPAIFYLRGVAPKEITLISMYRGVIPFVIIQIIALGVVSYYPETVLWLPDKLLGFEGQ